MATDGECANYARECVRLAGLTKYIQLRERSPDVALHKVGSRAPTTGSSVVKLTEILLGQSTDDR